MRLHPEACDDLVTALRRDADAAADLEERAAAALALADVAAPAALQALRDAADFADRAAEDLRWRIAAMVTADSSVRYPDGSLRAVLPSGEGPTTLPAPTALVPEMSTVTATTAPGSGADGVAAAVGAAGVVAMSDGPLPFGDAVALAGLAAAGIYVIGRSIVTDPPLISMPHLPGGIEPAEPLEARMSPSESEVWRGLQPHRGRTRTNGESGRRRRLYEWDYQHGEIEVYDRNGRHLGAMDAETGEMTKDPEPGRVIDDDS